MSLYRSLREPPTCSIYPPCSLRDAKTALTRKLAREEARNVLEAYVYRVRDLVEGGSRESAAFLAASVESERKAVRELQQKTAEWLFDEGESAETKELKEKKRELECVTGVFLLEDLGPY